MNTSVKLSLILIITIEISFTTSFSQNLVILVGSALYLGFKKIGLRKAAYLVLVPLIPALSLALAQILYGNPVEARLLFIRLYTYVILGADFTLTTRLTDLAGALEQNFHLPTQFVYGITGTLNSVTKLKDRLRIIRAAGKMRGVTLHFWSPELYFKIIANALRQSSRISAAMFSHGFVEEQPRTHLTKSRFTIRDAAAPLIWLIIQVPLWI